VDTVLADPLAWYELERSALLATVRQAAEVGAADHRGELSAAVAALAGGPHVDDWRDSKEYATWPELVQRSVVAQRVNAPDRDHAAPAIRAVAPPRPPRLELVASADTGDYTDNTVSARNRVGRRLPRRNLTSSRKESRRAEDILTRGRKYP
jgi:hypothetical protein